eukprot:s8605_g3.t1
MAPKKRDSRSQSGNAKRSAAESPSKKRFKLGAPVAGSIDLDEDVGSLPAQFACMKGPHGRLAKDHSDPRSHKPALLVC